VDMKISASGRFSLRFGDGLREDAVRAEIEN
jgi:hypothetical protein